jgi:anti-sigma B factor antagonist
VEERAMHVNVSTLEDVTLVSLAGEIDASTAPAVQREILALATGNGMRLLLDMNGVTFMSSAGLRMLLVTYRHLAASQGRVVLVGLSDDLAETMAITGFLNFFATRQTVDAGLEALRAP